MRKLLTLALLASAALLSCSTPEVEWRTRAENPEFLHRSIKQITDVIVHDIFSPPVASRIYTYSMVAAYEVAIHKQPNYISLAGQLHGLDSLPQPEEGKEYCYSLASIKAALMVGKALVFSEEKIDKFYNDMMEEFKATGMPEEVFDNSLSYGTKMAERIMKWTSKDNYKQSRSFPKYTVIEDPSTWKPTPPAYMDAVEPHWNKIRPFTLDSAAQFKPEPPPSFSSDKNSEFYTDALEVYNIGKNLTEQQKEIAMFWDCNPFVMNVKGHVAFATKKISPGGHWMGITRVACTKSNADFVQSAEAYTRVAISLIDGFIICWDEKYRSRLIRPETYINQYIDENWIPLLQTPPFPEYTSGHSVISASAAVALTKLFGDNFAFTDSTEIEFGLTARSFTSFIQASEEAAQSRIYGGIHYTPAAENGKKQGRALGDFIVSKIKTRQEKLAKRE